MSKVEELEIYLKDQRENHGLLDVKLFPRMPGDPPVDLERFAQYLLDLFQGRIETQDISTENL
jgi:hypothetical protein